MSTAIRYEPPQPTVPRSREERLAQLEGTRFDLLVIGGGITGAGVARDAALRGMRVALVERDDFASGTSSRSSRLIHGGLRYLEHGHLHLVFEASRERRRLFRVAPHLVRPLEFLWPVYEGARVPGWKLAAGLLLYDVLALFRNLGSHRRLDAAGALAREPSLRAAGLTGGAVYYDAATDDARLTLANAMGAAEAGAVVANHAEVVALRFEGGRAAGAVVRDRLGGRELEVAARVVVNAAGPWSDAVRRLEAAGSAPALRGTKGVHVALPRERVGNRGALTLLSPLDGRVMFVLPSGGFTIIGTTDTVTAASPDDVRASAEDVRYLLDSAGAFFPRARLEEADVVSAWAGIRPLVAAVYGSGPSAASREHALDWSPRGVLTVSGGKLTTYRVMAHDVVRAAASRLSGRWRRSRTARRPLPGAEMYGTVGDEVVSARLATRREELAWHLVHAYGARWREVWYEAEREPSLAAPLVEGLPYIGAELAHAVRREMAYTLADLLVRRTRIAFETRDHGRAAARLAADLVGPILGWSSAERAAAVAAYDAEARRLFTIEP